MFRLYNFDFLGTVSDQLFKEIQGTDASPLTKQDLAILRQGQNANHTTQGVYLLTHNGNPAYVGKADDVAERLDQHRLKIVGRKGLDTSSVGYKAVLLDKSMGTAASENILISQFKAIQRGMWNGTGFGPKDPGKNRDKTKASPFDLKYPVDFNYLLNDQASVENPPLLGDLIQTNETVASLFQKMKAQLPYVFRYDIERDEDEDYILNMPSIPLNLTGVPLTALELLKVAVQALKNNAPDPLVTCRWIGAVLHYGIVVYYNSEAYRFAQKDPTTQAPLIFK